MLFEMMIDGEKLLESTRSIEIWPSAWARVCWVWLFSSLVAWNAIEHDHLRDRNIRASPLLA